MSARIVSVDDGHEETCDEEVQGFLPSEVSQEPAPRRSSNLARAGKLMSVTLAVALSVVGIATMVSSKLQLKVAKPEASVDLQEIEERLPARLSILELLQHDEMQEAVQSAVVRMALVAEGVQEQDSARRLDANSPQKLVEEGPLRKEAALGLHATIQRLIADNPEDAAELDNVKITGAQGAAALMMLQSFTDKRLFNMGLQTAKAIHTSVSEGTSLLGVLNHIHNTIRTEMPELRRLHQELIPPALQDVRKDVVRQHMRLLDKKGTFSLKSKVAGWSTEVHISERRLQTNPSTGVPLPTAQPASTVAPPPVAQPAVTALSLSTSQLMLRPFVSTSQLILPTIPIGAAPWQGSLPGQQGGQSGPVYHGPEYHPGGPQQGAASTGFTPTNWFTIGAPVLSTMVSLTLFSLAALLPPTSGLPTNRVANYAIWGAQGGTVLAECLANIGFPTGVVYFASCIIDILFLGMEVVWVFFDGLPSNMPQPNVQCEDYSHWTSIDSQVCGNCFALVPSAPFDGYCSRYCASFGHTCVYAAEEGSDTCAVLGRYDCNERIRDTSDMLCQCSGTPPSRPGVCASFSQWPSLRDDVCGNCTAKVFASNCSAYCASFNHQCTRAYEGTECDMKTQIDCSANAANLFCSCESIPGAPVLRDRCAAYSRWPVLEEDVCGDCKAVVPANNPRVAASTTCTAFCASFGHDCSASFRTNAARNSSCANLGTALGCDERITGTRSQICECILR